MTKKDFELLAEIVAVIGRGDISRVEKRADWLNNRLTSINPRFNKTKFWDAVEKYRQQQ